ncbi:MAG: DUF3465 domain-containing protein [Pseudomonadota bacterium]
MNNKLVRFMVLLVAVAGSWLALQTGTTLTPGPPAATTDNDGAELLADAFDRQLNDEWIRAKGRVSRLLEDDNVDSRHQRFVIETSTGQTLLIAHNIDLAPRVPVALGDRISFKGVYEWNERGGVIHWTHHDPQGREPGGWIELRGKRYE